MQAALLILWKDLRQRARDRSAFLVAIVLPLTLAFIFSQILGGLDDTLGLRLGLVNEDDGPAATAFVDEVLGPLEEAGTIEIAEAGSEEEMRQQVADLEISAAFIIPAAFSEAISGGQPATLRVLGNIDASLGPLIANSIASAFAGRVTAIQTSVATVVSSGGAGPEELPALAERASAMTDPVTVTDRSAESKELDPNTFYAAGMAVFFLFFTVQFGIIGILDERRDGTLARMLAAPVHRWSVLVGKLLTSFVLGVVSMVVLAVASSLLFGAEWGNPAGVAVLIIAGVIAATSVGALVATFARTPDQASNVQGIIGVVLGMLGGSFFPVALAGGLIERLSLLTPHSWFLRGLGELQSGGTITDILIPTVAILAFAVVIGGLALTRQGRMVRA